MIGILRLHSIVDQNEPVRPEPASDLAEARKSASDMFWGKTVGVFLLSVVCYFCARNLYDNTIGGFVFRVDSDSLYAGWSTGHIVTCFAASTSVALFIAIYNCKDFHWRHFAWILVSLFAALVMFFFGESKCLQGTNDELYVSRIYDNSKSSRISLTGGTRYETLTHKFLFSDGSSVEIPMLDELSPHLADVLPWLQHNGVAIEMSQMEMLWIRRQELNEAIRANESKL